MTNEQLPPLPCCVAHIELGDDSENVFTSDQMRDYARAALAMPPKSVSGTSEQEREAFEKWWANWHDPHVGRVENTVKKFAAESAWQARAALADKENQHE